MFYHNFNPKKMVYHNDIYFFQFFFDVFLFYIYSKCIFNKEPDRMVVYWTYTSEIWSCRGVDILDNVVYKVCRVHGSTDRQTKRKYYSIEGIASRRPIISSLIFFFCTEVLIVNIRKEEWDNNLTGIKVARASQPVSHLLFTDDSLFFCKANMWECWTILRVLRRYEMASGQQINFSKSSVQFGQMVDETTRGEIMEEIGILTLGGMGTYLGIP